jgi:hypothetical protein
MRDSSTPSPHQSLTECSCTACHAETLTVPGTQCRCGRGTMQASGESGFARKAFGMEDTDLRKGGR